MPSANTEKALSIIENAKTSRPSVCNAMEVCLVHRDIAKDFIPLLEKLLTRDRKTNPVIIYGDSEVSFKSIEFDDTVNAYKIFANSQGKGILIPAFGGKDCECGKIDWSQFI